MRPQEIQQPGNLRHTMKVVSIFSSKINIPQMSNQSSELSLDLWLCQMVLPATANPKLNV